MSPISHRAAVRRTVAVLVLALLTTVVGLTPEPAAASAGDIVTYPGANVASPTDITYGPDGNLWFTSQGNNRIGRVTPLGDITTFTDPAGNVLSPRGITAGPDGNLWFTVAGAARIGRITPAGVITTFYDVTLGGSIDITSGPDGNLWFTEAGDHVGRITPSGTITLFSDPAHHLSSLGDITTGPDGNLWFTSQLTNRIGRITTGGVITTFTDPTGHMSNPSGITAGPDGNLWFTAPGGAHIGRITPSGTMTLFDSAADLPDHAGFGPGGIVTGPDGALWFVASVSNRVGRITTSGAVTTFPDPSGNVNNPSNIVSGPNHRLWFTSRGNNRIGRIEPATPCNASPPPHGFSDVPGGAWYGEPLSWATCHHIVNGFPGNVFRPNDPVNRAQAASIIWAFVDQPTGSPPHGFSDVSPSAWFARALDWVKANGVVNGFPGNVYRPDDPVNRAQIVSWLWELVGEPAPTPHGFSDVAPGAWFSPALGWAKAKGIVSGFPGNVYRPNDPVTRAQLVAMLSGLASNGPAWSNWTGPDLFTWRF